MTHTEFYAIVDVAHAELLPKLQALEAIRNKTNAAATCKRAR